MPTAPYWTTATARFDSVDENPPLLTTPVLEYRNRAGGRMVPIDLTGITPTAGTNDDGTAWVEYTTAPICLASPGTWVFRHYSTTPTDRCVRLPEDDDDRLAEIVVESDHFTD